MLHCAAILDLERAYRRWIRVDIQQLSVVHPYPQIVAVTQHADNTLLANGGQHDGLLTCIELELQLPGLAVVLVRTALS